MPKAKAKTELQDNVEVASEPVEEDVHCDNHHDRKARTFTGNGAYRINLCASCTPPWFKD